MPGFDRHAEVGETAEPSAKQGRGFHRARKDSAAAADECLRAEAVRPCDQLFGREAFDGRAHATRVVAIAVEKGGDVLAVRQVQAAASGEQEFSCRRRHPFVDGDPVSVRGNDLGCEKSGWPGADDGDLPRGFRRDRHNEPMPKASVL